MPFGKRALPAVSAVLAVALSASAGTATAQERDSANPGVVVEIYVQEDSVEIVCPTTACNAVCRDIEGTQLLLADTYYRIGSNCSLTITDGALLNEAIEELIAFLGDVVPGAPGPTQDSTQSQLPNTESNPNQNNPPVESAVAPTQLTP